MHVKLQSWQLTPPLYASITCLTAGQQQHVVTPANSSASRAAASAALSSISGPSQAPQDQSESKASQKQQKKKEKAPKEAKAKPAQAQGKLPQLPDREACICQGPCGPTLQLTGSQAAGS